MNNKNIDRNDKHIIDLLLADGRMSYSELAKKVGLSRGMVAKRIEIMRQRGIIEKFTVLVYREYFQKPLPGEESAPALFTSNIVREQHKRTSITQSGNRFDSPSIKHHDFEKNCVSIPCGGLGVLIVFGWCEKIPSFMFVKRGLS